MSFRIADTFTGSLAKLGGQEQKAVKTTAFDLQLDPINPGMRFHRIERAKDQDFWSVRVNRDIRIIVHKTASSLLLCYVDHHDKAYAWAERRRIERHPKTGAAQLVELRETVEAAPVRDDGRRDHVRPAVPIAPPLFDQLADDELLRYGVPTDWLGDVRLATEDTLFDLADHLPQEAMEALLSLATGETPEIAPALPDATDPFAHPDAQRRFRVLANVEELERALDFPWEKWTTFLHPSQRQLMERDYAGAARVSGSAGTGKTVVALHRAVLLARRHPEGRVLLTTFSKTLAAALGRKLDRMAGNEPDLRKRILARPIKGTGYEMYAEAIGRPNIASPALVRSLVEQAGREVEGHHFTPQFLLAEWRDVVDAWQLRSWEAYRDVARLGRKTRIGGKQRETLWAIFEQVRAEIDRRKAVTWSDMFDRVTDHLTQHGDRPFASIVVDEAQDIGIAELRFLAALGTAHPDSLFFTGDLGQRIFQQPFSWKSLGVDVRGRSHTLRVNYRTSHQIRSRADRLLPQAIADVDGLVESRRGAVSVFDGPAPLIRVFDSAEDEAAAVGDWIRARLDDGILPQEIGLFVRTAAQMKRARAAAKAAGVLLLELSDTVETAPDHIAAGTMHLAKGLEFRAVAVIACDDEVVPLQERIEAVTDESDLEEAYNTERHLLYVACTRARDHLLVTGVEPASEFLDDMAR